jgi:hypothetical protein
MFARGLVHMATEVDLNRWREAGKQIGRKVGVVEERKRIIKLLQEMQETALATGTDKGKQTGWVLENAIILIKGENK